MEDSLDIWCVANLPPQPHFLQCVMHYGLRLPRLQSVLRVIHSLLGNVSSPLIVQFYPQIQPVVCINVQH